MANFYISDLHIGHKNVLKFDNRPFDTLEQMHETIVNNWNSVVTPQDTVYVIGDILWKQVKENYDIVKSLNGNKILVKGNHDKSHNVEFKRLFGQIDNIINIKDTLNGKEVDVCLCHFPILFYNSHRYGGVHLYGHTHCTQEYYDIIDIKEQYRHYDLKMYNVGCMLDYMNYTPRRLEEIVSEKAKFSEDLIWCRNRNN